MVSNAEQNRVFKIKTNGVEKKGSDYQNDGKDNISYVLYEDYNDGSSK